MTKANGDFEILRGSGNVFRDCGEPDADVKQAKAMLAARIIGILNDRSYPPARPGNWSASTRASSWHPQR